MSSSNISVLKVLSVESDRAIRQEIHDLFVNIKDIDLAAEVPSVDDARSILPGSNLDIALVDLAGEQTFDLIKEIRQSSKSMRVVVVTASDSPEEIFSAMDAGADAYVLKRNLNKALVSAVRSVCLNTIWLDPDMAAEVLLVVLRAAKVHELRSLRAACHDRISETGGNFLLQDGVQEFLAANGEILRC